VEYLFAGASAVQVGTAHFFDPRVCLRLLAGLEELCLDEKVSKINSLRGTIQGKKG